MALTEHQEQSLVVEQLRLGGYLIASIPNDAPRNVLGHVRAKQRGLTKGAPDLVVFTPTDRAPKGVALEFKKRSGGKEEKEQIEFLAGLRALGWIAEFVHGAPEALFLLSDLGYRVGTIGVRP